MFSYFYSKCYLKLVLLTGTRRNGVIDLVLELYMLKNIPFCVPKKAFFASSHAYFSNKKHQNDVKKIQKNITLNQQR